jgi:hypothetical protein
MSLPLSLQVVAANMLPFLLVSAIVVADGVSGLKSLKIEAYLVSV